MMHYVLAFSLAIMFNMKHLSIIFNMKHLSIIFNMKHLSIIFNMKHLFIEKIIVFLHRFCIDKAANLTNILLPVNHAVNTSTPTIAKTRKQSQ